MVIVKHPLISKQEITAYDRAANPRYREHPALYPKETYNASTQRGSVTDL